MRVVEKISEPIKANPDSMVQLKQCGNIYEVRLMEREQKSSIRKISKDYYVVLSDETGEVRNYCHSINRAQNTFGVAQSLCKLRDLLNANITEPQNCLWVTLTYRENMRDSTRLYDDFRKFNQRLQYHFSQNNLSKFEYIVAMEPQGRGAWHAHCVLLFPQKAPFLANETLSDIWGLGFVKVKSLRNVDNIGLYLSAYLGDMEISEAQPIGKATRGKIRLRQQKAIVKGARLSLYPTGFKLFRHSRGIKYPIVKNCTEQEAMQEISEAKLTFEKTIRISEGGRVINTISYRHYNRKAKGAADDGEA